MIFRARALKAGFGLVCSDYLLIALTPALSQNWEREPETSLLTLVPLPPGLGEGAGE
jgi:hypothetical protein